MEGAAAGFCVGGPPGAAAGFVMEVVAEAVIGAVVVKAMTTDNSDNRDNRNDKRSKR